MSDLVDIVSNVPLFSSLPREDVAKIVEKLEETSYRTGDSIFLQGDIGDAFYLIQSGTVKVMSRSSGHKPEVLAVLGPREWFGEMSLLSGEARSATITAVKDTTTWKLSRESWNGLVEKHPTWQFICVPR